MTALVKTVNGASTSGPGISRKQKQTRSSVSEQEELQLSSTNATNWSFKKNHYSSVKNLPTKFRNTAMKKLSSAKKISKNWMS